MKRARKMKNRRLMPAALIAVVAMLVAAPAGALAQVGDPDSDPTAAQYESPSNGEQAEDVQGTGGEQAEDVQGAGAEDASGDEVTEVLTASASGDPGGGSGTLPFTGFDAGVMAAVALLLGGVGLTLRRLSSVE